MVKETAGVRLDPEVIARVDRATDEMSRRTFGVPVRRADVLRLAVLHGLGVIEAELGIAAKEPPPVSPAPAKKGGKPARKPK
jgi:hypothetical protein